MWASVAPGWGEHADLVEEHGAPITAAMLEASRIGPADRVLELACGPGSVGIAAAEQADEVVLSDVAEEMTAIAAQRAAARGLTNVSTRVLDLEDIDEPDASYDVVLCREGLMLTLDPNTAMAEIRRIMRPGGRAAIAVWGPRTRNPWLAILFDAVSAHTGTPVPPPGIPGPFSLGEDRRFEDVLKDAAITEVAVTQHSASFEDWWSVRAALAGPLAKVIAMQPPEAVDAIKAHARGALQPYADGDGFTLPGVTLLGSVGA